MAQPETPKKTGTRSRRKTADTTPKAPLVLPQPINANGTTDSSIAGTVIKKFAKIEILNQDGKGVKVTVLDPEKGWNKGLGSAMTNFFLALINSTLAGQGQGPDGSSLYIEEHWGTVVNYQGKDFGKYRIVCTPGGRSGAQAYQGSIDMFVNIAKAKAVLVRNSLEMHGAARVKPINKAKTEEPQVTISF